MTLYPIKSMIKNIPIMIKINDEILKSFMLMLIPCHILLHILDEIVAKYKNDISLTFHFCIL